MIWTGGTGNAQRILVDSCPKLLLCNSFRQLTAGLTSALLGSKTAVEVMIVPDNHCDTWALKGHGYRDKSRVKVAPLNGLC